MVLRAKNKDLFAWELTGLQQNNSNKNIMEMEQGIEVLSSYPRRLVFELTNTCNLNCVMCGRNAAAFHPTVFQMEWFHYFEPYFDIVEEVTLMGWGEPTMHPNFIEMLQILSKHDARIYFCTNGMRLEALQSHIFENQVDLIGVSIDGATEETNSRIRRGSSLKKIVASLEQIENYKVQNGFIYPYINFVFCAMRSNLHELPQLVRLAANIGLQEVKVVFLTAFDTSLLDEVLWDHMDEVKEVFQKSVELAKKFNIALKLPYLCGEDPARNALHRDCFVGWRDFFLGSDGYVRPCMSTSEKFFSFDFTKHFQECWNHPTMQTHRKIVNDSEKMKESCAMCYQSSHCNWNRRESFIQIGNEFSPKWK